MPKAPKHPPPDSWADLIHRERTARGWDQNQLAEILHVGQGTISRWENGHLIPSIRMQGKILTLFGLGPDDLWRIHRTLSDTGAA